MSQPICEAIAPQSARLSLGAEPSEAPFKIWSVQCKDAAGQEIAYLFWNADTGQLISMTCWIPETNTAGPVMNAQEAMETGRHWLKALGMIAPSIPLRFVAPVLCCGDDYWTLEGKGGNQLVVVEMNARSGDLICARCWTTPDTSFDLSFESARLRSQLSSNRAPSVRKAPLRTTAE